MKLRPVLPQLRLCVCACLGLFLSHIAFSSGVPVTYQLPVQGSLPATYLVTLAITDADNPDWIVSNFVAGQPRTVTKENQGKFTETWDGLDENFMPVPPGEYGVKGIYSPASKWEVDGEWHAITPKWAGGASSWLPSAENWKDGVPFYGDPVNSPMRDVAVGANGVAVFYYQYLENGMQYPMFDLNKPVGPSQFLRAFNSGGAGGGTSVATDGETVWAYSTDGGHPIVFRTDGKSFGVSPEAHRRNSYDPPGQVTDLLAVRPEGAGKTILYVAQHHLLEEISTKKGNLVRSRNVPSETEVVDLVTVHDGDDGKILTQLPLRKPKALGLLGNTLYALHGADSGWVVSSLNLKNGLPAGEWKQLWQVPVKITPFDMAVDSHGRFYLSDSAANKVYQLDAKGDVQRTYGRLDRQKPGTYDPETFMAPEKIATWTDATGKDRLLVVEMEGPNRTSEWSPDGKLIREFMAYQTKSNNGYGIDPDDASMIYLPGQGDWLTRFKINYDTHEWKVDAVWPDVSSGQRVGLDKIMAVRRDGRLYLCSEQNFTIYRLDGDRWVRSASLETRDGTLFFWNDANDNGKVDEDELRPANLPGRVLTYHGQRWLSDLSYIAPAMGGRDIWRAAPARFDSHGNPVFESWQKVVTDPVFAARAEGKPDAVHGGNELTDNFNSDWMQVDGTPADGYYVHARGGKSFTANFGAQYKVSRYVPAKDGGYALKWRVGRSSFASEPARGELAGGMRIFKPINGILSVIDQSRSGVVLYTEDGLFVDTLFPSGSNRDAGLYIQPGEFFAGSMYANKTNGKIYYASGKFTPFLYEIEGWSLKNNPIRPITTLPSRLKLSASQVGIPPEMALTLRGGVGKTSVMRFMPALGGIDLTGATLGGWESVEPVVLASAGKTVEIRCLYEPDTLFLRWHVMLNEAFVPKPLPPVERLFTHDHDGDTVGFYIQGDSQAAAPKGPDGRPGDVRFVFGLFKSGNDLVPAVLGMYPKLDHSSARPQIYRSPVGEVRFEHAGALPGVRLGQTVDADGKGFVLTAAIPRAAIPAMQQPFGADVRTQVNFDANLGGHLKFWWANQDGSANTETYDEPSEARLYPGSWGSAQFKGLDGGVVVRNWQVLGPFGGKEAKGFSRDPQGKVKDQVQAYFEKTTFPPDVAPLDFDATYSGELIQGYWPDPKKIKWTPETTADLDTRVIYGTGGQVWYGATWIYSPTATEVDFEFQLNPMLPTRWFVNGEQIYSGNDRDAQRTNGPNHLRTATQTVTLRAGWNQVHFRAYSYGYVPFRVGLVVKGPESTLWSLGFTGKERR